MRSLLTLLAALAAIIVGPLLVRADPFSVLSYHGGSQRNGHFIVPGLTWDRAKSLHLDTAFHATLSGSVYAQPLFWQPPGSASGVLIVATESNEVYALDARTGQTLWQRALGAPVPLSSMACGEINPLGVTGTPVIDEASRTLFIDAEVAQPAGPAHFVFALSLKDGAILPGWPVDMERAFAGKDPPFSSKFQNQRSALLVVGGMLYVPFGSFFDCRPYRGTVVGISLSDPHNVTRWVTRAPGGGIWAPGGIVSDGSSLFVATGNTYDTTDWADGEAIIRLSLNLRGPADQSDYFTPANWRNLDAEDSDLGGISPLLIDLPDKGGRRPVVLAIGKDGKAYLLDRVNLGGIGGALAVAKVSTHGIYASAAAYPVGDSIYVAFPTEGIGCPANPTLRGLIVLSIRGGNPPTLGTAWCGQMKGFGAPIVTTTDGRSNPIVWAVGAQGDGFLHAFKGDTGEVLFEGPPQGLTGLRRLQTLIATQDRLYVAADGAIYAFAF